MMRGFDIARREPVALDMAVLALRQGKLGVFMQPDEDDQSRLQLPHIFVDTTTPLSELAKQTMEAALAKTRRSSILEPLLWQTQRVQHDHTGALRVGYAAIANIKGKNPGSNLEFVTATQLSSHSSRRMRALTQFLIQGSFESLKTKMDVVHASTQYVRKNILPIAARLIQDPEQFTLYELYSAFRAGTQRALDQRNFYAGLAQRNFLGMEIVHESAISARGHITELWSMPPEILHASDN